MRITGLGSGMDIDYMVKEMMTAEKLPLDKLNQTKIWTEWKKDAYRETNLALASFRSTFEGLRFSSAFNAFSATTTGTSATAKASSGAVAGSYQVTVQSLAQGAKLHSATDLKQADGTKTLSTSQIGTAGTIVIKDAAGNAVGDPIEVTETMTMADVASRLQSTTSGKTTELRAGFDTTTSRFFISTKGMGEAQNFSLEFSSTELGERITGESISSINTATSSSSNVGKATNGSFTYDGIPVTNLSTNTATINGVAIELKAIGNSTITVSTDTEAPFQAIKKAITAYNEMIEKFEKQVSETKYRDFPPLTDEQRRDLTETEAKLWDEKAKSGLLRADPILRDTLTKLRRAFADPVAGLPAGSLTTLSSIGITTGNFREGGKLNIDETKLRAALAEKPEEVMQLFTAKTGATGVAERVYKEVNDSIRKLSSRAGSPTSTTDNSILTQRLKTMDTQIRVWQDRLVGIEERYWKQFSAMERAMNQMNQQSSWIQQNMMGGF
ncbi:flagellar filament capping protein FliD [Chryseomicrobium aureum]|uniref:flagellar filament capping protein FliD n=1 Tax=Chryseomicrobium aureum TaxID=1441723 RepID=UPI00370DAB6A